MFSEEEIGDRDKLSIWFSTQIILTTLAFIAFLIFLRAKTSDEYTKWDVKTTTISDYTMIYRIPEKIFNDFKDEIYPRNQSQSQGSNSEGWLTRLASQSDSNLLKAEKSLLYQFKVYLKNEFEKVLKETEHIRSQDENLIQISHIHLNFDNLELLDLLEERGQAIKDDDADQKIKSEKEIVEYCNENKDKICVPKEAYIIFETEEAFHRAMRFNSIKKCGKVVETKEWNGTNLILENISEPTNIFFENKYKSMTWFIGKCILVSIFLFIALCITCFAIFYFQDRVNKLGRQYPEVDCDVVVADSSPEMLVNLAMIEFYNYETSDKSDETIMKQNTDNLQCFCDDLIENIGYWDAFNREFDVNVLDEHITGKVCNNYLRSAIFIQATDWILPIIIIVFNWILNSVGVYLIQWLRFENKTVEISIIQGGVFVLMFFNSGLTILLINAYVPGLSQRGVLFNGLYSDFSDDWYDKISGFIVSPMFAEIIDPIMSFVPTYICQKGTALLDRNFSNSKHYKTKCNLAYDYAELNSGTEYGLDEKYSRLLNIVFISICYGFGLPLLPIIILASFFMSYTLDKLFVMFYHRKPPLYDDTLNKVNIEILKWAAFLYIAVAYWVLTNKQMFGNRLHHIEYQAKIETYDHYVFEMPDTIQEKIVLLFAIIIFIYLIVNTIILMLAPLYESTSQEELMEFEDLKKFPKALSDKDVKFWYSEEKNIREKLGYKYLFDSLYEKLEKRYLRMFSNEYLTQSTEDSAFKDNISDATNYDYLYILEYAQKFSYVPSSKRIDPK